MRRIGVSTSLPGVQPAIETAPLASVPVPSDLQVRGVLTVRSDDIVADHPQPAEHCLRVSDVPRGVRIC